jgi:hypothetical protein
VWCHCYKLSPFQAHWGKWHCTHFVRLACLFTVHVRGKSPPSLVEFSSLRHCHKLSRSWLLGARPPLTGDSPARPGLFIYISGRDSPPPSLVLRVLHPLCYVSLLFLLFINSFYFFTLWGMVWPDSYVDLAHSCLWEYHVPLSSPCGLHIPKPSGNSHQAWETGSGLGALLVSPFNVKWRFSAQAGSVECSKFASSWWPCLQGVSPACLQDFTLGGTLSASSF